jgi:hypothetical protein
VIVEELIGRLTLQTKGIDKAKQATKALQEFRKALQGLAGASRVNLSGPVNAIRGYKQLADAAKKAAQAQKQLAGGAGFGRADAAAQRHLSTVQRLSAAYKDAARSANQVGKAMVPRGNGGGRSWIRDEIAALRDYQRLQRQIAAEGGRRALPRPAGSHGSLTRYGAGHRLEVPGREYADEAKRRSVGALMDTGEERARQTAAGLTPAQTKEIQERSLALSSRFPSVGATEIEGLSRAARNAVPNFKMAMDFTEDLVKLQVALQSSRGMGPAADQLTRFVKALDNMGRLENLDEARKILNGVVKATNVEGKDLSPADFLTMARYAKSAGATLSPEYLTTDASTLMQDMGPSQLGTALGTMLSQMVGGRATKQSKRVLEEAGLADYNLTKMTPEEAKNREALGIKGKGTVDQQLLLTNPTEWARKYMIPALQKKGVNPTDDVGVAKAMSDAFSAQSVANFWTKTITQMPQLLRNREMYGNAQGVEESAKTALTQNPKVAAEAGIQGLLNAVRQLSPLFDQLVTSTGGLVASFGNAVANFIAGDPTTRGAGVAAAGGAATVGAGMLARRAAIGVARRVARGIGVGGGAGAAGAAEAGAAGAGAAGAGAGAAEAGAATAATGVGLAGASVIGTAIGTAAGAAFAGYATAKTLPKIAATGGPGSIDPATGEHIGSGVPQTTPWLRNWIQSKLGGGDAKGAGAGAAAAVPNVGAVEARLSEIQSSTQATADKMREALNIDGKLNLDSSAIDAAIAKIGKLKAEIAGIGSAFSSAVSGAGIAKGSNTFTSPGATAP